MFNRKRHHHARSGDPPATTTRSTPNSPSLSRCSTVTEDDKLAEVIFRSRNASPVYPDSVKLELLAIADCSTMERRTSNSNKSLPDAYSQAGSVAEQPILQRNGGSFSMSNSNTCGEGSSAFGLFRRKKDVRGSSFSYATRPVSVVPKPSRLHPVLPVGAAGSAGSAVAMKDRQLKGRSVSPLMSVADVRLLLGVDGQLMQQNCQSEPPSPPSDANDTTLPAESRHPKLFFFFLFFFFFWIINYFIDNLFVLTDGWILFLKTGRF